MDKILINSKLFRAMAGRVISKKLKECMDLNTRVSINFFELDHRDEKTRVGLNLVLDLTDDDMKTLFRKMEDKG